MKWVDIAELIDGTPVVGFRKGFEPPVPFAGVVDTIGGKERKTKVVLDEVSGKFVALHRVVVIEPETPHA